MAVYNGPGCEVRLIQSESAKEFSHSPTEGKEGYLLDNVTVSVLNGTPIPDSKALPC